MSPEEKEDLRHAVLDVVAIRHPSAMITRAIRRAVAKEIPFAVTDMDVESAAELLVSLGQFSHERDPLGVTRYYKATAAGVLAQERGGR